MFLTSNAQIKVNSNGSSELGSNIKIVTTEYPMFIDLSATNTNYGGTLGFNNPWSLVSTIEIIAEETYTQYLTVWSDKSVKTNITPLSYGLREVLKLKPVSYKYNSDFSKSSEKKEKQLGFIAQDLQEVLPEIVQKWQYILKHVELLKNTIMNKKLLSTLFLLLSIFTSWAQNHSIMDTTNTWNVGVNFVNDEPINPYNYWRTQIFRIEDTVEINSIDYRKIIEYDDPDLNTGKLQFYVREDSTGKVFYSDGTTEIVAFDFGLEPGDTFLITPSTFKKISLDYLLKATIDSASTILLNNEEYDAIYLTIGEDYTLSDVWVKGIGSFRFGLFYPVLFMTGGSSAGYYLLCFHNGKQLVYSNEQFNECYLKTSVNESVLNKKLITCSPIGDGYVKINMYNGAKGTFTLYSVASQKVWSAFLESSDMQYKINHSGLFLYCFKSDAGEIEQGKILIK